MALIKKNSDRNVTDVPQKGTTLSKEPNAVAAAAAANKAEQEPAGGDTEVIEREEAAAPAPAPAPSASREVAPAKPGTGAVVTKQSLKLMDVVDEAKNAYKVDWDTLDRVQANNGKFLDLGKGKASMGETIQLRLLSWQDNFQITPAVKGDEAADLVRYSDDGITTTKGEDCKEYLAKLRETFKDAKMTARVVLVGVLEGSEKDSRLQGEMIQIDLSNSSKKEFDKYRLGCAYKVGKELLTADAAMLLTMKCEIASANGNDWTKVLFEPTVLAA